MTSFKWRTLFLFILGTLLFVPSSAQDISIRGNVGSSTIRSPDVLKRLYYSGTSFGLEVDSRLEESFLLSGYVGFDQMSLNEDFASSLAKEGSGKVGDLSFLNFSLGLKYEYRNKTDVTPYLSLGWGKYQERFTNVRKFPSEGEVVSLDEKKTRWGEGYHLGVGFNFRVNQKYFIFSEPRYIFYDFEKRRRTWRYFIVRLGFGLNL